MYTPVKQGVLDDSLRVPKSSGELKKKLNVNEMYVYFAHMNLQGCQHDFVKVFFMNLSEDIFTIIKC